MDRIGLIVPRSRRTRQIEDGIRLNGQRRDDVMFQKRESLMTLKMTNVPSVASEKVINAGHGVTTLDEPITQVRAKKARSAGDQYSVSYVSHECGGYLMPALSSDPMSNTSSSRTAVGIMTGTSLDAVDVCGLQLQGHGLGMMAEYLGHASLPLGTLAAPLRSLAEDHPMPASLIAELRRTLGELCGEAVASLNLDSIDLIAVHGQTVHHSPPESWQLIDPFPIAQRFHARVATDLRGLDRAAGGSGAPITPVADWILHRGDTRRAIVNLGGFINCTILPPNESSDPMQHIQGFDICPCNHLLDTVARIAIGMPYDDGGALALSGSPCMEQVQPITHHLLSLHSESRSLGSGDECITFVPDILHAIGPADAAATFCAAIGATLAAVLPPTTAEVMLLAGGGTRNAALVEAITTLNNDEIAIGQLAHGDEREAASMAVLAALAEDHVPITLPQITGRERTHVRDGTWVLDHKDQC